MFLAWTETRLQIIDDVVFLTVEIVNKQLLNYVLRSGTWEKTATQALDYCYKCISSTTVAAGKGGTDFTCSIFCWGT